MNNYPENMTKILDKQEPVLIQNKLTHCNPVLHFYTPWKRQKT